MTALALLLALVAAGLAAAAGWLIAGWGAARAPIRYRYALCAIGFWMGPLVGGLTMVVVAVAMARPDSAPPIAMTRLASASDHVLIGRMVVLALLVISVAGACRLARLAVASAKVRAMIRRAREGVVSSAFPAGGAVQHVPVLLSDEVPVPLLAGIVRPVVLLPADAPARFTSQQLSLICAHEFAHARHHDNLWLWLEEAAGVLFWWCAPTMRMRRRLAAAREARCDATVLARSDARERATYAATLLQILGHRPLLTTAYANGDGKEVAKRIRLLLALDRQPGSARWAMLALIVMLAAAASIPLVAGRTIIQAGESFGQSRPYELAFHRNGAVDARTGRPLYDVTYAWPRGAAERLLSPPKRSETGTLDMRRQPDGGWLVMIG